MQANQVKMGMITAMLLLSSISCSRNGFETLPSSSTLPLAETPAPEPIPSATPNTSAVPQTGRWSSIPKDAAPVENGRVEPADTKQSDDSGEDKAPKNDSSAGAKNTTPNKANSTSDGTKDSTPGKATANDNQPKSTNDNVPKAANDNDDAKDANTKDPKDNSADFEGPGVLKPTIYYFVTFNEDESKCERNSMMHAAGGKDLLMVCEKTAKECGQQGSCAIIQNGVTRSFNVLGAKDGQDRFFEIDQNECRYGYGVDNSCLDPFYTLAADLSIYKSGDVIFVPGIVGMELPDGSKHSGYFVIRDKGRGVDGVGRFDFFSGTVAWRDGKNPFTKMGLGDVKTNIPYYKVTGKTARQVLRHRAFPKLPIH